MNVTFSFVQYQVSISSLKQLAITKAQHLPTLNSVIPFLEVSENQTYVAKRIRELGSASCLADFRWQGGSDFKGEFLLYDRLALQRSYIHIIIFVIGNVLTCDIMQSSNLLMY